MSLTKDPKQGVDITFIKIWRDAFISEDTSTNRYVVYQGTTIMAKFPFQETVIVYV